MQITDRGYSFATIHNADGDIAHVEGRYQRYQTQAPIRRNQPFELEFYGRGAGLTIGVTAIPRRAVPAVMAAARRRITTSPPRSTSTRVSVPVVRMDPTASPGSQRAAKTCSVC